MLARPTTFIVGAGASCEFALPDGSKLTQSISRSLDIRYEDAGTRLVSGDAQLAETFRRHSSDGEWQRACWRIRNGLPGLSDSIDIYLANHSDDAEAQRVGRAAIVKEILSAEANSKLKIRREDLRPKIEHVADSWIGYLFRILNRHCPKTKVQDFFKNCRFVVFNYDRCIEHYFEHALTASYAIDRRLAQEVVASAPIIHVYGSVGSLPGHGGERENEVEFGSTATNMLERAGSIRTYTDQVEAGVVSDVREYIGSAATLVFLGFGFHPQNVDLLAGHSAGPTQIIGSAYGLSEFNIRNIGRDLVARLGKARGMKANLENRQCSEILRDFSAAFDR